MKKLFVILACVAIVASCGGNNKKSDSSEGKQKSLAERYVEAINAGDAKAAKAIESESEKLSEKEQMAFLEELEKIVNAMSESEQMAFGVKCASVLLDAPEAVNEYDRALEGTASDYGQVYEEALNEYGRAYEEALNEYGRSLEDAAEEISAAFEELAEALSDSDLDE